SYNPLILLLSVPAIPAVVATAVAGVQPDGIGFSRDLLRERYEGADSRDLHEEEGAGARARYEGSADWIDFVVGHVDPSVVDDVHMVDRDLIARSHLASEVNC